MIYNMRNTQVFLSHEVRDNIFNCVCLSVCLSVLGGVGCLLSDDACAEVGKRPLLFSWEGPTRKDWSDRRPPIKVKLRILSPKVIDSPWSDVIRPWLIYLGIEVEGCLALEFIFTRSRVVSSLASADQRNYTFQYELGDINMEACWKLKCILLVLVIMIGATQAATVKNQFTALKQGETITGRIGGAYTTHVMDCSRR